MASRLDTFSRLQSSLLLEAEVRAAFARERLPFDVDTIANVNWVLPDRSLGIEIDRVTQFGYLRGADLFHLACALYATPDPFDITFLTLDQRQGTIAAQLGFQT